MARDLNRLFEDIRNSRPVFVTQDGRIEDEDEASDNADNENRQNGQPRPRTELKPEVFGAEELVRVPLRILEEMHAHAAIFPGETGGILTGTGSRTVTKFIPSGTDAFRTTTTYHLDPKHLQPLLNEAEARGERFLGVWHSHPEGANVLSEQDRETAAAILADPDYDVTELLLPLSVRVGDGFETRFYVAHGSPVVVAPVHVVACSSPGDAASAIEPGGGGTVSQSAFATAEALAESGFVRDRLRLDQQTLRAAGWHTTLHRLRRADGYWAFRAQRGSVDLVIQLPVEYPLSPPDVYARRRDGLDLVPPMRLPELGNWSSSRSLLRVADRAFELLHGGKGGILNSLYALVAPSRRQSAIGPLGAGR